MRCPICKKFYSEPTASVPTSINCCNTVWTAKTIAEYNAIKEEGSPMMLYMKEMESMMRQIVREELASFFSKVQKIKLGEDD